MFENVRKQNRHLSEDEMEKLLTEHWRPDRKFDFPSSKDGTRNRKPTLAMFEDEYFKQWIVFSKFDNGIYCAPCAIANFTLILPSKKYNSSTSHLPISKT